MAPRVLLVRFSALGDVLLTTPLIRALREKYPDATLTALTKESWAPLLSANPHLDQVVALAPGQSLVTLARALRRGGFTHRLDLHASVRSRMLRLLMPGSWDGFNARRRERTALIRLREYRYRDETPVPERYFEAARSLSVSPDGKPAELFTSPAAEARAEAWLAQSGIETGVPIVVLAPGAAHATKRWPQRHWQALAAAIVRRGMAGVVLGSERDRATGQEIAAAAPGGIASAAGQLDLQASAALVRRAGVLVSGDSGPMHMATAVGTPVVALFGPTVRAFGFFPYCARAIILERELACRPCSSKGSPRCPLGHHRCMEEIVPPEVLTAVETLAS